MGKINEDQIKQIYSIAKGLHEKKLEAIDKLHTDTGMNKKSADFFIQSALAMMEGRRYERRTNELATRTYLENIHKDFGDEYLRHALFSLKQHISYVEEEEPPPRGLREIHDEFLKRL